MAKTKKVKLLATLFDGERKYAAGKVHPIPVSEADRLLKEGLAALPGEDDPATPPMSAEAAEMKAKLDSANESARTLKVENEDLRAKLDEAVEYAKGLEAQLANGTSDDKG
jgi:hypothetical protein